MINFPAISNNLFLAKCASEAYISSYFVSRFAVQALSDMLGLTTLRHGTNYWFWNKIHLFGGNPKMGGNKLGGDKNQGFDHINNNKFFMAKDAFSYPRDPSLKQFCQFFLDSFEASMIPRFYAARSNLLLIKYKIIFFKDMDIPNIGDLEKYFRENGKIFMTTLPFMPIIKLHMNKENIESLKLKNDDSYKKGEACYTENRVSPLNIGLLGVLYNGLNLDIISRIKENPNRFLFGLFELASSLLCFYYFLPLNTILTTFKVSILAGAIMGAL